MDSSTGGQSNYQSPRQSAIEAARRRVLESYDSTMKSLKKTEDTKNDTYITPPVPGAIYSTPDLSASSALSTSSASSASASYVSDDKSTYNIQDVNASAEALSSMTDSIYNDSPASSQSAHQGGSALSSQPMAATPGYYDQTDTTSALKDTPINQTAVNEEWQKYHSAWQKYYQDYYNNYYSQAAQNYLETEKLKTERIASGEKHRKRQIRRLLPIFAIGFVVLVLLFLQYNRLIFAPIMAYVSPDNGDVSTSIEAVDPSVTQAVSPDPRLLIPKLNIDVPVAFDIGTNEVMTAMNHGVAQFKIPGADAMPGEVGNLVISGHSAGDIYSSNPYKFIFSGLERLNVGDLIYVNYNSVRYTYRMTKSEVVDPSNVAALVYETDRPMLTLITCTPLGTSKYRLLITAEQISPEYDSDSISNPEHVDDGLSMPSNSPSFFENIFGGIFGNS